MEKMFQAKLYELKDELDELNALSDVIENMDCPALKKEAAKLEAAELEYIQKLRAISGGASYDLNACLAQAQLERMSDSPEDGDIDPEHAKREIDNAIHALKHARWAMIKTAIFNKKGLS